MAFPIKVCAVCSEEFELRPDKPGFANRCPECSEPEHVDATTKQSVDADERKTLMEANEARRQAMRNPLPQRWLISFPKSWRFNFTGTLSEV
jgi:hypothetical protein